MEKRKGRLFYRARFHRNIQLLYNINERKKEEIKLDYNAIN